jgi:mRNA-degrading endonuclease YafQ of YafQ-DinJ toxin-antitoxin module
MSTIILFDKFQKELKSVVKGNSKLKNQIHKTVNLLQKNIDHPSLRLHKLSGQNNWAISVTKSIRIIMHWEKETLYLLRVGKHEDVY